jgi:hypothetical protein
MEADKRRREQFRATVRQGIENNDDAKLRALWAAVHRTTPYPGVLRRIRAARASVRAYKRGHYALSGRLADIAKGINV